MPGETLGKFRRSILEGGEPDREEITTRNSAAPPAPLPKSQIIKHIREVASTAKVHFGSGGPSMFLTNHRAALRDTVWKKPQTSFDIAAKKGSRQSLSIGASSQQIQSIYESNLASNEHLHNMTGNDFHSRRNILDDTAENGT